MMTPYKICVGLSLTMYDSIMLTKLQNSNMTTMTLGLWGGAVLLISWWHLWRETGDTK